MRLAYIAARMRTVLLAGFAMGGMIAPPADAEGWTVSSIPKDQENGPSYCAMLAEANDRTLAIWVYPTEAYLSLSADDLVNIPGVAEARLTFPSGATAPARMTKNSPDSNTTILPLDAEWSTYDVVANQFSQPGAFTVQGDGWRFDMPTLSDGTLAAGLLRSCKLGLDNTDTFDAGLAAYEQQDFQTAYRLWLPLAEQGYALAQLVVASLYFRGDGVPQDDRHASAWVCRAARMGLPQAQEMADNENLDC